MPHPLPLIRRPRPAAALVAAAALGLVAALTACTNTSTTRPAAADAVRLAGAGSTFDAPFFTSAFTAYQQAHPAVRVRPERPPPRQRGDRAVVVEVPASIDGPHLIYKNDYFGAPVRNDSDTVWMKERQIEAMYRARFDERRHATEALDALFTEASAGRDTGKRASALLRRPQRYARGTGNTPTERRLVCRTLG